MFPKFVYLYEYSRDLTKQITGQLLINGDWWVTTWNVLVSPIDSSVWNFLVTLWAAPFWVQRKWFVFSTQLNSKYHKLPHSNLILSFLFSYTTWFYISFQQWKQYFLQTSLVYVFEIHFTHRIKFSWLLSDPFDNFQFDQ